MPSGFAYVHSQAIIPVTTNPQHRLDRIWGLRSFIGWLGFRKDSRGWDWHQWFGVEGLAFPIMANFRVEVDGDPTAKPNRGWWSVFWNTNFGWQRVAVLKVNERCRVGYAVHEGCNAKAEYCSVLVGPGMVAMLVGPTLTLFFALPEDSTSVPIPVSLVNVITKAELPDGMLLI